MSGPAKPALITTSSCETLLSLLAIKHSDISLGQTFSQCKCPLDFEVYYKCQVWTSLRWVSRFRTRIFWHFFWSLSFVVPQAWRVISPLTFSTSPQFSCYVASFRANVAKKIHRKTFPSRLFFKFTWQEEDTTLLQRKSFYFWRSNFYLVHQQVKLVSKEYVFIFTSDVLLPPVSKTKNLQLLSFFKIVALKFITPETWIISFRG